MTDVCVKTWPSDVWTIKVTLEVKEAFEEAEAGEEDVLVESTDEDATLVVLDDAALEGMLDEDELITELEVLEATVVGVVVGAAEVDTGAALVGEGVALGAAVVAGVVTGA
jgi:hypothetical protein